MTQERKFLSLEEFPPCPNYQSPFDAIPDETSPEYQNFSGNVSQILEELNAAHIGPDNLQNRITRVVHPPRLVWAAVNYKIASKLPRPEDFILRATQLALASYENKLTPSSIKDFRNYNLRFFPDFLSCDVNQVQDVVTWEASKPKYSKKSVQNLIRKCGYGDILFIAMGQGGIACGMDVFLRYKDFSYAKNSLFYTARLSMHKVKDEKPQLDDKEIKFLKKEKKGRRVVIFDEDLSSGSTIEKAQDYFYRMFDYEFPEIEVNFI